jgi:hypothetical protein
VSVPMTDIFLSGLESLKKRQATIMDAVSRIAECISDPDKRREASRLAEELPKIFEDQNRSIIARGRFNALKLQRNQINRDFLLGKAKAMRQQLESLVAGLEEASKNIPEPKCSKVPLPKIQTKKPERDLPKLLTPQELRDQIARKIERPPAPPQTTGNIWENWGKNPQPPVPPHADEEDHP